MNRIDLWSLVLVLWEDYRKKDAANFAKLLWLASLWQLELILSWQQYTVSPFFISSSHHLFFIIPPLFPPSHHDLSQKYVEGRRCDSCHRGYHTLEHRNSLGCLPCACDLSGTVPGRTCDMHTGQCPCQEGVEGAQCTNCAHNYYNRSSDLQGKKTLCGWLELHLTLVTLHKKTCS